MEVNDRFSIGSYLGKGELKAKPADGVNSTQFSGLVSKSQKSLQERLDDKDLQGVLKNKSVSMMFLDKITRLLGEHHPDTTEASKFMFGPSFFPSMELIRHLSGIKSEVSPEAQQHLEEWIEDEKACLPIALIFDAWLLVNEELVRQGTTKGTFSGGVTFTITPPPDEVEAFANALATEMKGMKPGDKFKMPAGSVQHVTRLQFIKNSDGSFDVLHFNTGLGATSAATAAKFASIPAKKLEDPEFWKKLVAAKMQPDMDKIKTLLLESTERSMTIPRIDDRLKKSLQESDSCSYHAAEAEFKYSFISSFPTIEEGWKAYKQSTSLMASNAAKQETSLEPAIERMLIAKEKVRRRYMDWMSIVNNPEKFESAKNAYRDAIVSVGKYSDEDNKKLIANQPPLMVLKLLEKRLNEGLNTAYYQQLAHIRDTYGWAVFNHIGYKQLKWLEATREVLQDAAEFAGMKGALLLKMRSLSTFLLPDKLDSAVQTNLNYAMLDKASLTSLLTEYLLREDPEKGNQILQMMIQEKAVDDPFIYDENVIKAHIQTAIKSNPQRVLELLSHSKALGPKLCKELYKNGHIEEAYEAAKLLEGEDQQEAFARIGLPLLKKGHKEQFLSLLELSGSFKPLLLVSVVEHYCDSGEISDAIAMAHLISDERVKQTAWGIIAYAYLDRNEIDEAVSYAKLATTSSQSKIFKAIVDLYCRSDKVSDAIAIASMMSDGNELAFGAIARAFLAKGNMQEAAKYAVIAGGATKSSVLQYIVEQHCNKNNMSDAVAVANMKSEEKELAYHSISKRYIKQGNFEEAVTYANMAGKTRFKLLESIIEGQCQNGKIADAIAVANMMTVQSEKEKAFEIIAGGFLKKGNLEEATEYASKARSSQILESIVDAYIKKDSIPDALSVANMIDGINKKYALSNIAKAFLAKGNLSEAVAYAAKAGVAGSQILKNITEAYCKNNDTLNAIATASTIQVKPQKEAAFDEIARAFIVEGNFEEAIANAKIAGPRFESKILKSIVEKHCENKDTANATAVANMILDVNEKKAAMQMIQDNGSSS